MLETEYIKKTNTKTLIITLLKTWKTLISLHQSLYDKINAIGKQNKHAYY